MFQYRLHFVLYISPDYPILYYAIIEYFSTDNYVTPWKVISDTFAFEYTHSKDLYYIEIKKSLSKAFMSKNVLPSCNDHKTRKKSHVLFNE
jgi:hypothetical protein